MDKLLFLIMQRESVEIAISQYVTITFKLVGIDSPSKKGTGIVARVDNHSWISEKKFYTPIFDLKMLEGFWDIRQVQEYVDEVFPQERSIYENKLEAKINLLYHIQENNKFSDEQKYLMQRVLDIVCYKNYFQLAGNCLLTIADTSDRAISPYDELHFQIIERKNNGNSVKIEYLDLYEEQIASIINRQINTGRNASNKQHSIIKMASNIDKRKEVIDNYFSLINQNNSSQTEMGI